MSRVRALVLDFDGVILESNDLKTAAFDAVFSRFPEHQAAMMAFHHAHVAESRYVKFRHLATAHLGRPADDPIVEELVTGFSTEMQARLARCPMVAGADAFLDRVRGRLPLYLASMTPAAELDDLLALRGLRATFTGVYGCPPWPKEQALNEIVAVHGRDGLLFIGDSAGDQRAAARTGIEFIGRDSGLPFDEPLPRSYPNMVELLSAIDERLP